MNDDTFSFHDANVVDVARGAVVRRSVVVEDGVIASVHESRQERTSNGIDASDLYLCPGLIDCHVHFFLDCGHAPRVTWLEATDETRIEWAKKNAQVAIAAGITTMRDLAAPAPLMFDFQRQVDSGDVTGPHIISCGYALMRPAGHCHWLGGGEVTTVGEVRHLIEHQLEQGAGFVKLMASGGGLTPGTVPHEADLRPELMREAAEVAHANGVQITAHCHATESIERAIESGLDMIEHVNFVEPPGRYRYDEEITLRIRDHGIVVSPTVFSAIQTVNRFRKSGKTHNPGDVAAVERLEGRQVNTAHFHRLGLKIIGGTDCGATDTPFDSLIDEIIAYTEAGLSTAEALRTVTSDGAAFMNIPKLGEVKEGCRADFTLLRANPLKDLRHLRKPVSVFKAGRLVHEAPVE